MRSKSVKKFIGVSICCYVIVLLAACSENNGTTGKLADTATFDVPPTTTEIDTPQSQLKRYRGQTNFLSAYSGFRYLMGGEKDFVERSEEPSSREIAEADIFKIGKDGSKQLFLLNRYRGLQIIDYTDGELNPKLIGRAEASTNWPEAMYYDKTRDRIIVLERLGHDQWQGRSQSIRNGSQIVVYDVSDPTSPKIKEKRTISGEIAESRIVGDVLYVAIAQIPSWELKEEGVKPKGLIKSFDLSGDSIREIQSLPLTSIIANRKNMNIIVQGTGDEASYYLVAVTSADENSWWSRKSRIEVIDISDASGMIKPVMNVNPKGFVRERSQTLIKNNTLVVVSNYGRTRQTVERIAVETFNFPTIDTEYITEKEATYRKLHIDREVEKRAAELASAGLSDEEIAEALDLYREELVSNDQFGLKGEFVKITTNGVETARKIMPDSVVTVGDTSGLNARLQDVRISSNLLFVFWVPANNMDPLEVFDLSAPQRGVPHMAHLEFDGWIQRAIPVTYKGQEYIIGLGWVFERLNDERRVRHPQVVLFRIDQNESGVTAEKLQSIRLSSSCRWSGFNGDDNKTEVREYERGKGVIMFACSGLDGRRYVNGGKLVGYDLNTLASISDTVFTEGAFLANNSGWLRRVFSNPEIDKINSFSDMELGTFDVEDRIGPSGAIVEAVNTLELARNIVAYINPNHKSSSVGVQVIDHTNWFDRHEAETELRVVDSSKADSEKTEILSSKKLAGRFVATTKYGRSGFLMLTRGFTEAITESTPKESKIYRLFHLDLSETAEGQLTVKSETSWIENPNRDSVAAYSYQPQFLKRRNGEYFVQAGGEILKLNRKVFKVAAMKFNCPTVKKGELSLKTLKGMLYGHIIKVVPDKVRKNIHYSKHFFSKIIRRADTLICKTMINVPGEPIDYSEGSHLVTRDVRVKDIVEEESGDSFYYRVVTERSLDSLKMWKASKSAMLIDMYDPGETNFDDFISMGSISSSNSGFVTIRGNESSQFHTFSLLGFDGKRRFTENEYVLKLNLKSYSHIIKLVISRGSFLALLSDDSRVQVVGWNNEDRPKIISTTKLSPDGSQTTEQPFQTLRAGACGYNSPYGAVNFSPHTPSFELPLRLAGVTQLFVTY